ncbi:accessory gene regulator B family protein [Priestia endophytica]|uniref:accessory gene regulator B family protein n=1 Tax=Priestia endophytica TaxID=135735 RepID=UPI000FA4D232|nr:accessory gene regulator B family protein [Priestia endophytica]RPJ98204.1 hypothetical protein FH5_03694 [Priestia endophytica]
MTEKFATSLLDKLVNNSDLQNDRIKYLKCKYALEFLILNISKLFLVYLCSFLLGISLEVLIFHLSFMCIRIYGFGAHSHSNLYCTLVTLGLFTGIPLIISQFLLVSKFTLGVFFLLNSIIIFKYAPADATGDHINDIDQKRLLRKRAMKLNIFLAMFSLLLPSLYFSNLIGTGAFFGSLMLLPLTNYLLNKNFKKRGSE